MNDAIQAGCGSDGESLRELRETLNQRVLNSYSESAFKAQREQFQPTTAQSHSPVSRRHLTFGVSSLFHRRTRTSSDGGVLR